jgi:chitinase
MTYDYHGHWDKKTGHLAPLYQHPEAENKFFNVNYTLNYWIQMGAEPLKIIMGFPLYGQSFTLTDPISNNSLNAPSSGTGLQGPLTRQAGFLAYYEVCLYI